MSDALQYTLLDCDIHKFVWQDEIILKIVEEYAEQFETIYQRQEADSTLRIMHVYHQSASPRFYMISFAFLHFVKRDDIILRIAYVLKSDQIPFKTETISRFNQFGTIRKFFDSEHEQNAIDWLLGNEL